ncbi:hypothetical protein BH09MYX1_BH09MYX1_49150 [soil metagenome]
MAKMETKNPKTRILFTLLILAVFTFVGIKFALDSYWTMTTEAYAAEILPPNTQLSDLRAKQKKDLESSPTPINVAMQDIANKGRGSSEAITPQQSTDLDPLRGWSKMKKDIPDPVPPPPPVVDQDIVSADGGVVRTADGGTADGGTAADGGVVRTDAGAAVPAPKKDGGP